MDKKINVLIIDDNIDFIYLCKEYLNENEFVIDSCDSLLKASEVLTKNYKEIDIILLDLGLPESSGFSTFEKVRSMNKNLPVVVLTNLKDDELQYKLIQEGADDYLEKNEINPKLLKKTIYYAIERNKYRKNIQQDIFLPSLLKIIETVKNKDKIEDFLFSYINVLIEEKIFNYIGLYKFIKNGSFIKDIFINASMNSEKLDFFSQMYEKEIKMGGKNIIYRECYNKNNRCLMNISGDSELIYWKNELLSHGFTLALFQPISFMDSKHPEYFIVFLVKNLSHFVNNKSIIFMLLEILLYVVNSIYKTNRIKEINNLLIKNMNFQSRLLEVLPLPVFYKDEKGVFTGCNKAFEKLFGVENKDIIGKTSFDLMNEGITNGLVDNEERVISESADNFVYETIIKDSNKNDRKVLINKSLYYKEDGTPAGLIGIIIDLSNLIK